MDDAQLLRSFVEENSSDAFQRVVTRHVDLVYSAALRRTSGDPHRAEEVTQMVFTDLARKSRGLLHHPCLPAWLHQATRWSAASLRRSEHRRTQHETLAATDPAVGLTAENDHAETSPINWSALRPLLDDALDSLNDTDRAAILQRFFNQAPFAAIATRLGVSENAARMRVDRALAKLRAQLARRGLTSTSAALGLALAQHSVTAAPAHLASNLATTALAGAATVTTGAGLFTTFFMTNLHLALATAATLVLAAGLAWQTHSNHSLRAQLRAETVTASANSTGDRELATLDETLRQLDSVLAHAATVPALTPEQQERQQLDTFIRKGELDGDFAPLFRKLRLPAPQLDALKSLLVERNQAVYDALNVAVKEGFGDMTRSETTTLGDAAAASIDADIARLLGRENYQTVRDYLALQPFRNRAIGFVWGDVPFAADAFEERLTPEHDRRVEAIARILAEKASNYFEQSYRANGWPIPFPEEALVAIEPLIPESSLDEFRNTNREIHARRRKAEIARDAALQGKLTLREDSARDYPQAKAIAK